MGDFSKKQLETIRDIGKHNRELHVDVFGCGKTYCICVGLGLLCKRLRDDYNITGLRIVLMAKTLNACKRNICNQLSRAFGESFKYDKSLKDGSVHDATLFGQELLFVGLNDTNAEQRIRGLTDIWCVVHDETILCTEEQFNLVFGRIRGSYNEHIKNVFNQLGIVEHFYIGSTNPDGPRHWLKKLIDNNYFDKVVTWSTDDARWDGCKAYYENLFKQYPPGSIERSRYLQCQWVAGSGVVFKGFIENKDTYIIKTFNQMDVGYALAGLDIGGNKSGSSLVITGIYKNRADGLIGLVSKKLKHSKGEVSPDKLYNWVIQCIKEFNFKYNIPIMGLYVDCAEQYIENGCREAIRKVGLNIAVGDSVKGKIMDRVKFIQRMFSIGGLHILDTCDTLIDSLSEICYDERKSIDTLLDNGSTDNDTFDAFSYSFSSIINNYNIL